MKKLFDFILFLLGFKPKVKIDIQPQIDDTSNQIDDTKIPEDQLGWSVLLKLHNDLRSKNNRTPLLISKELCDSAQSWSINMAKKNLMYHGPLSFKGFSYTGENIGQGYQTMEAAFSGWKNSPGHKANIINGNYTHVGFGMQISTRGIRYWCVQFGRKV